MSDVDQKMSDARIYLATHAPYFLDAILKLIPYETDKVPTFAVTPGMVMLYNPQYVRELTDKQIATRYWHEVHHVLRDSPDRLTGIDPMTANRCQDLAINSSGKDGPWDFGPDGLLPGNSGLPEGLTAEQYYDLLPKQGPSAGGGGGSGCGKGQCGGIAGNPVDPDFEEHIDQTIGRSSAEKQILKIQIAKNLQDHAMKTRGRLPGGWEEWAKALLTPSKVPWEAKFASVWRDCYENVCSGMADYSMRRPSRRTYTLNTGIIYPGLINYQPEIALVVDTSGSMSIKTQLAPALREARRVILASGCDRLWFMEIDAELGCQPRRASARDLLKLVLHGRGGTSFIPAFEIALKLRPKPNLLIYFTDGVGPAPETAPTNMSVIWCIIGTDAEVAVPAPWGKVVRVES